MSAQADPALEPIADALYAAHRDGGRAPTPTQAVPGLDLEGAYAIQRALIARHLAAGDRPIGWKVGLGSAVGRTPDTPGPMYGRLLESMLVEPGAALDAASLHGPHAEGEIALVVQRPLAGPAVTVEEVLAATAAQPALEIFARRLEDGVGALADLVADNAMSAHLVLGGEPVPAASVDLRLTGLALSRGEALVGTGAGAQVLGHPAAAVAWLAGALHAHGEQLRAGDVILTGAVAGAHPAAAGDVFTAEIDRLGSVSVRFR